MTARANAALFVALCFAAGLAAGCGDDIGTGPDAGGVIVVQNSADDGHQHTLTISCAAIDAGMELMLTTTEGPDHEHAVVLSAGQLSILSRGGTIAVEFTDGHPHRFMIDGSGC